MGNMRNLEEIREETWNHWEDNERHEKSDLITIIIRIIMEETIEKPGNNLGDNERQ